MHLDSSVKLNWASLDSELDSVGKVINFTFLKLFDCLAVVLATAFETVYFWPGLEKCFAEVCRVLKPGGVFLICNESDGCDEGGKKFEKIIDGMKCYTAGELSSALKAAGFSEVKSDRHPEKPWLAVVAVK